eukprot:11611352-Alexandrium_andersonii.AAC.1
MSPLPHHLALVWWKHQPLPEERLGLGAGVHRERRGPVRSAGLVREAPLRGARVADLWNCLLYTSDAADDM